ncbi:MAG: hypothetical protein ACYS9T_09495 [Planctomycetota bacterium]
MVLLTWRLFWVRVATRRFAFRLSRPFEVNMVDDEWRGDFYYAAVHVDGGRPAPSTDSGVAFCVEGVAVLGDVPSVFVKSVRIFGVDDGEFALSQGYSSEGVAVAEAAVRRMKGRTSQPEM